MTCTIIDGKGIRKRLLDSLRSEIETFKPKLIIHVVGENPVIETYVRAKMQSGTRAGIEVLVQRYPADILEEKLIDALHESEVLCDGMILQLPIPAHLDKQKILDLIPCEKDVDLLSEKTWLRFENGITNLVPPVAGAVLLALDEHRIDVYRKKIAIVGYGKLVGQPVSIVLKRRGAYIEIIDSKTSELARQKILREADVIVTGVGKQGLIMPEHIKDSVVLLDGGTSESSGGTAGDIDFSCESKASYFARVPGGLGPLTVASLLKNVLELARGHKKG
jgi:methylenetetrahydrofolate dehydrogenase (NADP+)/methenyltetrahydrofolate cyclohydrolase